MKIKIFFSALISILFVSFSFAQDSGMKVKTLKVNPGGKLTIFLSVGDIGLNVWNDNEIKISYDEDEGEEFNINQSGNNVSIRSSSYSWGNDLHISLPSKFNISAKTLGGDIKLDGDITGDLDFSTSGGDVKIENVEGFISLKTSGGDISTGNVTKDADVSTSGGDIKLGRILGKADINTAGGNISIKDIGSSADVRTGGGNVSANNVGSDAYVKTGGGNISLDDVSGKATLKTGGGNISLKSAAGYVDVQTGAGTINIGETSNVSAKTGAGDIFVKLSSNVQGDCYLKSGTGSITLYIPENAKVTVDAVVKSFGWGNDESSIISDFPASGPESKHGNERTFNINGGGKIVKIYAALGSINIKKAK